MKQTTRNSSPDNFLDIKRNPEADGYMLLLHEARSEIIKAMDEREVSRSQLAKKLDVSRSVISRVLDPTSDVLLSTLFDLAWALGKQWQTKLYEYDDTPIFSLSLESFDEIEFEHGEVNDDETNDTDLEGSFRYENT